MIGDLIAGLLGEALLGGVSPSRRAQLLARLFFGVLGAGLGVTGAVHFLRQGGSQSNPAMSASMVALFVFLACFCLFNVALGRTWRWPGVLFVVSFVSLFVVRIWFGP